MARKQTAAPEEIPSFGVIGPDVVKVKINGDVYDAYSIKRGRGPRRLYRALSNADLDYDLAVGQQPPDDAPLDEHRRWIEQHREAFEKWQDAAARALVMGLEREDVQTLSKPDMDGLLVYLGAQRSPEEVEKVLAPEPQEGKDGSTGSPPAPTSATSTPPTTGTPRKR